MENFVGALTGIKPVSLAYQAGVLTTTPQHPGTKCIKFASSNYPWQMVLQHVVITTVFSHCESSTYTVVQVLLSWSADQQDKGTHRERSLSTWWPKYQSPYSQVCVVSTTQQYPGTKYIKFASSNHPWQMALQHVVIITVFSHCESVLLSWSADQQDKGTYNERSLSTRWPQCQS